MKDHYWLDKYIVFEALKHKYGEFLPGRNRACFQSAKYVVKYPLNLSGEHDNLYEAKIYKEQCKRSFREEETEVGPLEEWGHYARCRVILIRSIPILVMERIKTDIPFSSLPEWSGFIDCHQVGLNRHGNFKAYDYGYH